MLPVISDVSSHRTMAVTIVIARGLSHWPIATDRRMDLFGSRADIQWQPLRLGRRRRTKTSLIVWQEPD